MKFASIIFALATIGADIVGSESATAFSANDKHPLEDRKSWDLHVTRQLAPEAEDGDAGRDDIIGNANARRFLQAVAEDSPPEDEAPENTVPLPYSIKHKKPKKHIPFAGGDTTHGIMIDAGSVSLSSDGSIVHPCYFSLSSPFWIYD